jgi:hypothetical protein
MDHEIASHFVVTLNSRTASRNSPCAAVTGWDKFSATGDPHDSLHYYILNLFFK